MNIAAVLLALTLPAMIVPHDRGVRPEDWPDELEPFRGAARSLEVATGLQETIHFVPFEDRETFERLWPTLRGLATPGAPLTLRRPGGDGPWGKFLPHDRPGVWISTPLHGPELAGTCSRRR